MKEREWDWKSGKGESGRRGKGGGEKADWRTDGGEMEKQSGSAERTP